MLRAAFRLVGVTTGSPADADACQPCKLCCPLHHAVRLQAWQSLLEKLLLQCLLPLMATCCYTLLPLSVVCSWMVCRPSRRCLRC